MQWRQSDYDPTPPPQAPQTFISHHNTATLSNDCRSVWEKHVRFMTSLNEEVTWHVRMGIYQQVNQEYRMLGIFLKQHDITLHGTGKDWGVSDEYLIRFCWWHKFKTPLNPDNQTPNIETICPATAEPPPSSENKCESDEQAIDRLARLSELEYERVRLIEAELLGLDRVSVLDKQVERRRKEIGTQAAPLVEILEPWPHRVDGAELLEEIHANLVRHTILPEGAADTISMWALGTFAYDAFRTHLPPL